MNIKINYKNVFIQDVKIGDHVKSFNIENSTIRHNKVYDTLLPIVKKENQTKIVTTNGYSLITSDIHPMCFFNKETEKWDYKKTGELIKGDIVKTEEFQDTIYEVLIGLNEQEQFYDISVKNDNNFFAGEDANKMVVVHNSATAHYPFWHPEIEDIVILKNNRGNDLNRARRLDHSIQLSRLFYRRFLKNEDISLFSTSDVPGLYEAFGYNDKFDPLYEKYEADKKIPRKTINARDLMSLIAKERLETGRIYIQNIDNVNEQNSFKDKIYMSNLCQEIVLPTTPLQSLEDGDDTDAEIALCTLAGYNLGAIKNMETLKLASKYIIFILDKIIDLQDYPVPAARKMLKRRSIGVGVTNYAYWLMKNDNEYGSKEALIATDELFEHIQYYLLEASNEIAKEKGAAEWFHRTKYVDGIFTKDHYNKNVDKLVKRKHTLDWKTLKKNVMEFGLRNSVFTALMPVESCVSKETKIKTEDGIKSYEDILIEQNIDFKSLEEKGEQIWIDFEKPFNVETMNGLDVSERIFYNGKKEVYSITFEDNNVYKMTGNHKLLVNRNDEEIWTRVDELKEGDNIVNINQQA